MWNCYEDSLLSAVGITSSYVPAPFRNDAIFGINISLLTDLWKEDRFYAKMLKKFLTWADEGHVKGLNFIDENITDNDNIVCLCTG